MSPTDFITLLDHANIYTVLALFVLALPGILAYLQGRQTNSKVIDVHNLVNSKMTELLAATKGRAFSEGHAAGVAAQKADDALAVKPKVDEGKL